MNHQNTFGARRVQFDPLPHRLRCRRSRAVQPSSASAAPSSPSPAPSRCRAAHPASPHTCSAMSHVIQSPALMSAGVYGANLHPARGALTPPPARRLRPSPAAPILSSSTARWPGSPSSVPPPLDRSPRPSHPPMPCPPNAPRCTPHDGPPPSSYALPPRCEARLPSSRPPCADGCGHAHALTRKGARPEARPPPPPLVGLRVAVAVSRRRLWRPLPWLGRDVLSTPPGAAARGLGGVAPSPPLRWPYAVCRGAPAALG
jgi:hypothetical protein